MLKVGECQVERDNTPLMIKAWMVLRNYLKFAFACVVFTLVVHRDLRCPLLLPLFPASSTPQLSFLIRHCIVAGTDPYILATSASVAQGSSRDYQLCFTSQISPTRNQVSQIIVYREARLELDPQ